MRSLCVLCAFFASRSFLPGHPGLLFGLAAGIQKESRCRSRFYRAVPDGFSGSKRGAASIFEFRVSNFYFPFSSFNFSVGMRLFPAAVLQTPSLFNLQLSIEDPDPVGTVNPRAVFLFSLF